MTSTSIVEAFDVAKDVLPGLGKGSITLVMNALDFKGGKKAFSQGIIITVAGTTHADLDVMGTQQGLIVMAGVLTAPVRMMEQARLRPACARYEDEQPDGPRRIRAQEARWDWGRMAREFLIEDGDI